MKQMMSLEVVFTPPEISLTESEVVLWLHSFTLKWYWTATMPDMLVGPVAIGVSRGDDVSTSLCLGRSLSLSFHQLRSRHIEPDSSNIINIYSSWNRNMFLLNECFLNRNWLQTTIPHRYVSLRQWWLDQYILMMGRSQTWGISSVQHPDTR